MSETDEKQPKATQSTSDISSKTAEEMQRLRARATKAESELEAYRSKVKELTGQVQTLEQRHTETVRSYEERAAFGAAGIDDEQLQDVARYLYGRLPEDDRPAFAEWLQAEDGARSQPALAPHLSAASEPPNPPTQAPASPPSPPPSTERTAQAAPVPRQGSKLEQYEQMVQKANAVRHRDPAKYKELILAADNVLRGG